MMATESLARRNFDADEMRLITTCLTEAHESSQTRWIARVVEADVEDVLECYAQAGDCDRFFWQRVEADESFCGLGTVDEVESGGASRFCDIRDWAEDLDDRIHWIGSPRPAPAPLFLGGFGFEAEAMVSPDWKAFPAARFVLPEILIERRAGQSRWILFVRVEPGATEHSIVTELDARFEDAVLASSSSGVEAAPPPSAETAEAAKGHGGLEFIVRADRSHASFRDQIIHALAEIEAGRMAKIVLARSLSVDHDADIEIPSFLERLRTQYPSCTLMAIGRGKDTFLAATPETLIRVEGHEVESAALAGSAPRGRHPEEDRALGQALLDSEKENLEHGHVVCLIRDVVESCCEAFEISEKPTLRRLVGIQHLETRLRGHLKSRSDGQKAVDLLELVEALHPTPAVGGVPAANAVAWLRRFEELDRGWYAAPVGWLDREGGGDFCVALRSALIRNGLGPPGESGASRTLLFAGAGIVSGSDPEQELIETRIKLRALLALMTEI
jgi:salicylate biosynthesis isochorismate synthase